MPEDYTFDVIYIVKSGFRVIGGLFGRVVGRGLVDIIGIDNILGNRYWMWIDPGAFALIGAASFFGGVARLTMSLTVIMVCH